MAYIGLIETVLLLLLLPFYLFCAANGPLSAGMSGINHYCSHHRREEALNGTDNRGQFSSWRDKVSFNSAQQRSKASNFGHLVLPRGVPVFKEEGNTRVNIDILPYMVTDTAHPSEAMSAASPSKGHDHTPAL